MNNIFWKKKKDKISHTNYILKLTLLKYLSEKLLKNLDQGGFHM